MGSRVAAFGRVTVIELPADGQTASGDPGATFVSSTKEVNAVAKKKKEQLCGGKS